MKKITLSGFILVSALLLSCGQNNTPNPAGAGNPATIFCIQNGGKSEIRKDAKLNEYGMCIFNKNGKTSECEEFAFFKGECKPQ